VAGGFFLYFFLQIQKITGINIKREVRLRYINIPLLLSLNADKTNPVNFNTKLASDILLQGQIVRHLCPAGPRDGSPDLTHTLIFHYEYLMQDLG
jgi:hypothetical protein